MSSPRPGEVSQDELLLVALGACRCARQHLLEASEVLWMRKRPLVGLPLYNVPDLRGRCLWLIAWRMALPTADQAAVVTSC